MRVLITGSRFWTNERAIQEQIDKLPDDAVVIHGACRGADRIAGICAEQRGLEVEVYPAQWDRHGKAAGVIRNQIMLDTNPDLVIAFPREGGTGTQDMMRRVQKKGIPMIVVECK